MRSLTLASTSLRIAWRNWRLTLVLWLIQISLALAAVQPVARLLNSLLSERPEGDLFLERFSLPLFSNLIQTPGAAFSMIGPMVGSFAAIALLLNAFSAGGALEVLLYPDHRSVALRFARGGGRTFGRFLRMGLAAMPAAALVGGLLSAPIWLARGALSFRDEAAKFWLVPAGVMVAACGMLLVLLALDVARVRVACTDSRRAVRLFVRTLLQVLRHPLGPFGLWLALALPLAVVGLALISLRAGVPVGGGLLLLLLLTLQQASIVARAFYRVALWAGEIRLAAGSARHTSQTPT